MTPAPADDFGLVLKVGTAVALVCISVAVLMGVFA